MKVAFAGFGHMHILSIYNCVLNSKEHSIESVCEPNEQIALQLEQKGITVTHNSYESFFAENNADIVAVGACFGDRGHIIIDSLNQGKHVIADKPICTRSFELDEIEDIINRRKLKLGCMLTMRYMGKVLAIRDLIQGGELGEIKTISYGQQHPLLHKNRPEWFFDQEKHGGVLNDIAVHGIDLIRFMTGLYPEKILAARCWNGFAADKTNFLDCAQFMLRLSNGAGVVGDVSYSVPDGIGYAFPTYWEIFGTRGAVRFSLQDYPTEVFFHNKKEATILKPIETRHTYWDDFIKEINGDEDILLSTKDVIRSTRDALMLQNYADNEKG